MCIIRFIHLMALICQSVHCENALFSSIIQCCFLQPDALQEIFHPEVKILSLFTHPFLVSNPYDFSSTQRENCNESGGFKFQKECKNTKSSPYNLCASFVWQTNKYLSCYSLIIFSSVSSKLLHPELLSSRIKSVSSKWFCYTGWTDSLKRSISKERFIHKWLLLSWMFMKVSIMASEHVWRYFHVAFLPFLSSGPHAISMVIEKRGQDVAQKFTFCVTELKESRIGLERQVSDDRIQIFGSFMYKMKSMCLFLVESSSITPFPLLIHDLFSILLVWTVKGYRKSVLFACLQVLFWSSLMMFIALKSCWSWRVLVLV